MRQRNRKRFDPEFKARVALEALREKESLAQLGRRHGVHPVLVGQWKKQLLEKAAIAACHAEAPSWEATDWAQIRAHFLRRRVAECAAAPPRYSHG